MSTSMTAGWLELLAGCINKMTRPGLLMKECVEMKPVNKEMDTAAAAAGSFCALPS